MLKYFDSVWKTRMQIGCAARHGVRTVWRHAISLVALLVCLLPERVFSAGTEDADLAVRIPSRKIKVGFYQQTGFYDCRERHPVGGYGYDYLQHLRRYAPWQYEYRNVIGRNWIEASHLLKTGEIDILPHVRKTAEREKEFDFSKQPSGQASIVLTVKSGDTRYREKDFKNWNGIRVGVLKASNYPVAMAKFAKENAFTYDEVLYDDAVAMFSDLQAGKRIDAVLFHNLRRLSGEWVIAELDAEPFYIAVRKGDTRTLEELNRAQSRMIMSEPGLPGLLRQSNCADADTKYIQFTEPERAFIEKMNKTGYEFTALLKPDRFPLSYYDGDEREGIVKELADEILRRTGLKIKVLPLRTLEEYQAAWSNPSVDFILDFKNDLYDAEKRGFVLSAPYLTLRTFLVRNKSVGEIKNLALIENYLAEEQVKPLLPEGVKIRSCRTTREALDLIRTGECDATCLYTSAAEYAVHNDPKGHLISIMMPKVDVSLAVGTRDDRNPLLVSIMNKSVASIPDEKVVHIVQKYKPAMDLAWSLERFAHHYPLLLYGVPLLFLLMICSFLFCLLRARKNAYRLGVVFGKMPFRYFFADASGKLLQYDYGNAAAPSLRSLSDVPDMSIRMTMQKMVSDALFEKKPQECMYVDAGRTRMSIVSPVPDTLFGCPAVIGISRDITDLQKSHEETRKSEEHFRLTLKSIGDGVIATDKHGNITMLNPVAERMMGVKLSEASGKPHVNYFKIVSSEDGNPLESPVLRTLRTGTPVELANHTDLLSLDGVSRYHISDSSAPILDDNGKILGAILVFRDVTEEYNRRKENAGELAKWEAAAEIAQLHNFRFDPKTRRVSGSGKLSEVWPIHSGISESAENWIYKEDYPAWKETFSNVAEGKIQQTTVEYRVRYHGKFRYFRGYMRGTLQSGGEIIGLLQEITSFVEEKQKQNALQTLWATCREVMPLTLFIKSATDDFRYLQCNSTFAKYMGRAENEIIGRTDAELLNRPEDAEKFRKCDQIIMSDGNAVELHESMHCADGKIHYFMTVKIPTTGLDGKPVLLGMSFDETEDHLRREKLDSMLDDWEAVANVARIASYRLDMNMHVISKTDRITEFWPVGPDGVPLSEEKYLIPEDVAPYREMYADVFTGRKSTATMLCHVPHPDGMRYLRLFIKRMETRPNEISGLIQDVTEQTLEQKKREALLAMWRNVVDTLPALFFVKNADDDFRYLQINEKFKTVLNISENDVLGHTEEEFLSDMKEAERNRLDDEATMRSGKRQDFLEKIHAKNGELLQFQTVKIPSEDEEGRRIIITMSQDITSEQQLSETRRIISSAFETLFSSDNLESDMCLILKNICNFIGYERAYICCVDEATNGVRVFASCRPDGSKSMYDLANFRVEHVSTLPWYLQLVNSVLESTFNFDFSVPSDREEAKKHIPSILERAKAYDVRGVHINYISLKGKPWGCVGFITCGHPVKKLSECENQMLKMFAHLVELSITRKRMLDQLQNALTCALAADKAKTYFLSSMSHEIRTPLNAIIGFTDLLKDRGLDDVTREEYLNAVAESSHALLTLLNDILELSKLTSGKKQSHPVRTDMKVFVQEMDVVFQPGVLQKKLTLEFVMNEIPPLYIDQPQLRQIFFNLIGNAIKFTKEGGVKVSIQFTPESSGFGMLTIEFADTGIGILPEDRDKLFEPFIQMTRMRGTNASGNGTGLGLSIVKKTVEQMGGTLLLDSEVGRGTTFTIVLPHVGVNPGKTFEEANDIPISELTAENASDPAVFIPEVLIVDDSEMALEILSRMLHWLHVPHSAAHSGKEALLRLDAKRYDIVMTDILMPEMNGVELAQSIRRNPLRSNVRIVAMSTENESVMYDKKLFDRVMLKPIIRNALYDEIFGKADNDVK